MMNTPRDNKRNYRRLPLRGFLDCFARFRHGNAILEEVPVLSLSAGGMFIALAGERAPVTGEAVSSIRFSLEELADVHIESGLVVHQMSLGEIGGCGVSFSAVSTEDLDLLDEFVHRKLKDFGLWNLG
jgi:hypothetical protein